MLLERYRHSFCQRKATLASPCHKLSTSTTSLCSYQASDVNLIGEIVVSYALSIRSRDNAMWRVDTTRDDGPHGHQEKMEHTLRCSAKSFTLSNMSHELHMVVWLGCSLVMMGGWCRQ
ncbi:uncharacterized protein YALI1_E38142g [Yarrowia lipolytica]|uniref:Uncharacterized protein n=1 Tax=Yarrowia lipolytica TaxID=4952 RepID=A0A1D8NKW5_YARLL|nr:hypothetical protein YALI1_E38142g [Yarrowia lipolytica]